PSGNKLWGTYYGGEIADGISCLDIDQNNNIYVGGNGHSVTGIATTGTYQPNLSSGIGTSLYPLNGILAKFNSSGFRICGTYFGASCTARVTLGVNDIQISK